jgi:ABC-type multidrug transport system ATPase subunit/ABC-type multidrug transport system permease subunit
MPKQEKLARVDEVIKELGLTGCQHTLVGDETLNMKGISGGQRRRLSVGIELIKDPPCLYCDEPTSGLDSESAAGMMTILKSLAENSKRTVIVTIHQPNSQITAGFQDFLLLAGGRVVYTGQWSDAVTTFADRGYQCPPYMNPTDYFLSVLADDGTAAKLADVEQERLLMSIGGGGGGGGGVEVVVDKGEHVVSNKSSNGGMETTTTTTAAEQLTTSLTTLTSSRQLRGLAKASSKAGAPFLYQVWVLSHRMLKMWIRNPIMLISEASQYIFMALFVGLMYFQLNNSVETGVSDRAASMWFAMAVLSFTPSYTAATLWDKDRVLVRKEAGQGMYSVHSWFWAKTATTVPMEIIQTTLFVVISFFMVGYAMTVSNFFVFLAAYIMFQITSESIGLMCGMATSTATYAILVLTFVLLFLLSFSGFLVSDVPVYFAWIGKISYLTYAYAAVVIHDFDETDFVTSNGEVIPGSELIPPQINNGLSVGVNLLILLGLMVGTRLFAWLALYLMAKFKKL